MTFRTVLVAGAMAMGVVVLAGTTYKAWGYRSAAIQAQAERHLALNDFAGYTIRKNAGLPMTGDLDPRQAAIAVRAYVHNNFTEGDEALPGTPAQTKYASLGSDAAIMKCGGAADAYAWAMKAIGVPARTVQIAAADYLAGNPLGGSHVLTEVFLDGAWEISDPYYDIAVSCGDDTKHLATPGVVQCLKSGEKLTPIHGNGYSVPGRVVETAITPYHVLFAAYSRRPSIDPKEPFDEYPRQGWLDRPDVPQTN